MMPSVSLYLPVMIKTAAYLTYAALACFFIGLAVTNTGFAIWMITGLAIGAFLKLMAPGKTPPQTP